MRFPWSLRNRAEPRIWSEADVLLLVLGCDALNKARAKALECSSARNDIEARYWASVASEVDRRLRLRDHPSAGDRLKPDQLAIRERLIELCRQAASLCNDGFSETRLQHACAVACQIELQAKGRPEVRAAVRELISAMETLRLVEPPREGEHYTSEALCVMRRLLALKDVAIASA